MFLSTPFVEYAPAFSPDGRWLAYWSDASGRPEVYVRPFSGPGGPWQISSDGGAAPNWSPESNELFYFFNDKISHVRYQVKGSSFVADKGKQWETGAFTYVTPRFDVHPDSGRLVVRKAVAKTSEVDLHHVVFIDDFFDYLKERVPAE